MLISYLLITSCDCPKSADVIYYKQQKKLEVTTKNAFIESILIHDEVHYDFVDNHKDDVRIYRKGNRLDNKLDLNNIDSNYIVEGNLKETLSKNLISFEINLYLDKNTENNYDSRIARFIVADTSSNKIVEKYGGGCK